MSTTNHGWGSAIDFEAPPPKRKRSVPLIVGLGLLCALFFVTACTVGVALLGGNRPLPKDPIIPPYETGTSTGDARTGSQGPPTVAPPVPVSVKGKNNAVVPVGATLNGAYTVEYKFGWFCGIATFLKADGSDGAKFLEGINECATDTNAKATGSTVVHLTNVTMVKVENSRGDWSLKFTPLG